MGNETMPAARRLVLALVWLLAAALPAAALVFPPLTGRVVDQSGILAATRTALEQKLAAHEANTTDQIVVATVPSLQGTSIEDFANQLFRHWQLGQKDKNNGILVLVAPTERKGRIEVGRGLEGTLTDAVSRLIIENSILPRFRAGDFAGGIDRGVDDITQVLTGDADEWKRRAATSGSGRGDAPNPLVAVLFVLLFGAIFLIIIMVSVGPRAMPGSRRRDTTYWWPTDTGGSGWSSPDFGSSGGGGGFSGGGGDSGGGGASGSW